MFVDDSNTGTGSGIHRYQNEKCTQWNFTVTQELGTSVQFGLNNDPQAGKNVQNS